MEVNGTVFNENGDIVDILSGKTLKDTPEERVRQNFIAILQSDYGYPKENIKREVPLQRGSKTLTDGQGGEIRADIVVYSSKRAALASDQGNILFIVECKQPNASGGYAQLVSYIYNTSAAGGVWTNGDKISVFRRRTGDDMGLDEILSLPRHGQSWLGDAAVVSKRSLPRPKNVRFLLSSCHNKLYGRGMENEDFDLTMDMVRILLAKIQDETAPGDFPQFWITEGEFSTAEGRRSAAQRVQRLFREYADQYPDVFDAHEKIQVGDDCIAEAVGVLKDWSLAAANSDADDWDLMGEAYEQFTHINLKRQQGQFFTNRLVVDMMVSMLDPGVGEHILDPAGGSGGFATACFRYMRRKVLSQTEDGSPSRDRQLSAIRESVYSVEIAPRLVKIAKCAMLLSGDGQSGMTRGNSLGPYDSLDPWIRARCRKGTGTAPSVIMTNPPFSGQKTESMVSDREILKNFTFGHAWVKDENGRYGFSDKDEDILQRQAPEILFLERCLDWLKPGGRMGIVVPKGFLDNVSYEVYRRFLLKRCELNAVVTLHKDAFKPDTGVRTCILFISKPDEGKEPRGDYRIFMAQSQRIGRDSKGNPVFVLDGKGVSTGVINHDLCDIAKAYAKFKSGDEMRASEYIFSVRLSDVQDHFNINPQHYSPKLNDALRRVLDLGERDGWSTSTVGQLESGMEIYIGPRWNSSGIKVDSPSSTSGLTPYLTANGALELRRFTVKWIDMGKATPKQKACLDRLWVKEGDILITRSGSVGKVTYATKDMADKYLVSDDLIRVRVKDASLRAYLLAYLSSKTAGSLMLLDEYGSMQQHLQPRHIQEMVVPVPDDWEMAEDMISAGREFIRALEGMSRADNALMQHGFDGMMDARGDICQR